MARLPTRGTVSTLTHRPGATWSQVELGEVFDFEALSVIGDLDPAGTDGFLEEVLSIFLESLEPMLIAVERERDAGSAAGIRFEAHKLKSGASQVGARRLAEACDEIMKRLHGDEHVDSAYKKCSEPPAAELDLLANTLISEAIRVQRKLRRLLAPSAN